jgi:hypothetical protein
MPILAEPPKPPAPEPLTQALVDAVMAEQQRHCAPSTWDKFVRSLAANRFPFRVGAS